MEIVFVPAGEAAHLTDPPASYGRRDPELTPRGREQAVQLRRHMPLDASAAVVAGPAQRMLQTAQLWAETAGCARWVHPLAGPRPYPLRLDFRTAACDLPLEPERIRERFPGWQLPPEPPMHLWLQGIDTMPGLLFAQQAQRFLAWCRALQHPRIYIVTDSGTRDGLTREWNPQAAQAANRGSQLRTAADGSIALTL